jgi:periplasmic protein TonB
MRVAVRLAGDDAERILMKIAGVSAVAHLGALIVFSVLPRFMTPPPMPRATIAEIVPASALQLPGGTPEAKQNVPTPSQRAEAAKKAQLKPEPPRPVEKKAPPPRPDPKTPPLEPAKRPPAKAEPPKPEPPAPQHEDEPEEEPPGEDGKGGENESGGISFGGAGTVGGIPSIGSSAFPYDYYRSSLVSVLQSNWRRPVAPDGLTRTVSARVQFTILKSGIIQDPRLVERSGNEALDQSALRAVYDSNPLPPLPFQYGFASVTAEVVFELTPD